MWQRALGALLRRAAGALLGAAALLGGGGVGAQAPASPWSVAPGTAVDLAISAAGVTYASDARGNLWLWRDDISSWSPIQGNAIRIAAGPGYLLWGVRADGAVARYDGVRWQTLPEKARDVAVDAQGNGVIARTDGSLARWNEARKDWDAIPGRGHRVAVHADGSIWSVAEDGGIARHDGQAAETLPGRARDIAIGGTSVLIASSDGRLQRWNPGSRDWDDEPGASDVAVVAVTPGGVPWTVSSKGAIQTRAPVKYLLSSAFGSQAQPQPEGITFSKRARPGSAGARTSASGRPRAAAAASFIVLKPPGSITDASPFDFVDTRGTAARLAIGPEGSVFAIATDGSLTRWSNARSAFIAFPGSLVRIAVDSAGSPWGINQFGRIFRHTGTDWRQVLGTASDIAVAVNGTVMIASSSGVLGRFDPQTEGFLQVQGELFFLALAPDGTLWGLAKDGTVLRCPAIPCEQVGREAKNISIGPDGSVFIVTFSNELRRFNAAAAQFEFIPVPGHTPVSVAVGPFGRPWVVTSTGKVLSSRFFDRDESVDQQTAGSSTTPTTGSGSTAQVVTSTSAPGTGFSFSKSMPFTLVTAFPPCGASLDDIAVGVDGTVLAVCDMQSRLMRYNTGTRTFVEITGLPTSAICSVDVDSEGRIWIADQVTNGRIYRQRQKNGTSYETITVPLVTGAPSPRDMAIGPDDSVYYIDAAGTLFRRTKTQASFTKFVNGSFTRVAIGAANDVWLVSNADGRIYQLVGTNLELRPPSGPQPATVFEIGGGADGSIYAVLVPDGDSFPTLYKWNAANRSFDRVNRTAFTVDVAPNGRPWVIAPTGGAPPLDVFMAK